MKLMIAEEFGSTALAERSLFQALSAGKGSTPLRLAPAPTDMALHAEVFVEPVEPEPPVPLPPVPDPLPVLVPPPLDEPPADAVPPQPFMMIRREPSTRASVDLRALAFTHSSCPGGRTR